ncbi:MAG TPA: hypothetical protein VF529_19920 [Solirubrobacteraceae bacterium]|jgi:hypothetical protein
MDRVDFAGALANLVCRLGDEVVVALGGVGEDSPPFVAEMSGTLRAVEDNFADDLPELDPTQAPVVFGFEEHDATFALDPLTFRAAFVRGDHLELTLGSIAIEVRVPTDD